MSMTEQGDTPETKRAHRSPHGPGLYVTDQEIADLLGVPPKIAQATIRSLDSNRSTRFPKKQPLFGNRRYWPAVKAYLDRLESVRPQDAGSERKSHDR